MPAINRIMNNIEKIIKPYIKEEYFLLLMGSIFLLGIVGIWITKAIYVRLNAKAQNMVTSENKLLKKIKTKYENYAAVNGTVTNSAIMVEKYINQYKVLGLKFADICKVSGKCAVLALMASGIMAFYLYNVGYEKSSIINYLIVGMYVGVVLDIYQRSQQLDQLKNELLCTITDFLENTLTSRGLRQDRIKDVIADMAETEEKTDTNINPGYQRLVENYQQEVLHTDLEEDSGIKKLREQEWIINEVLSEFL